MKHGVGTSLTLHLRCVAKSRKSTESLHTALLGLIWAQLKSEQRFGPRERCLTAQRRSGNVDMQTASSGKHPRHTPDARGGQHAEPESLRSSSLRRKQCDAVREKMELVEDGKRTIATRGDQCCKE